jgi:predicted pyridoxine 5'-phosphate oxidase superfamily flavin-nucleotide-binding protein
MDSIYHSGERKFHEETGAVEAAAGMGRMVLPVIAHVYIDFIQSQRYVIIGAADNQGMAWGSILSGEPGFMQVVDEQTLRIDALPHEQDPVRGNFREGAEVGLLLLDFVTRRRLRVNGRVVKGDGWFSVRTSQVYPNCPRYIQSRNCESGGNASASPRLTRQAIALNRECQERIGRADTFFVASYHPEGGADVSHRGGYPGFVRVVDGETILWPDYNGNGMFNTLGNIVENPACGLLFLDFEKGGTLQLSGAANVIRDSARAAPFPGAERIIEFRIQRVIETENATSLRWSFIDYSPDNPWFC